MVQATADFGGSVPEYYDRCLGPAWFDEFGADLAARLPARPAGDVLEVACGTGRVTGHLRRRLDAAVRLVATDLSPVMLAYARANVPGAGIEWREADACKLPFPDGAFAALVCSFGLMFVPEKAVAFAEARRVLREGGSFLFSVWDGIDVNPHSKAVGALFETLFPGDAEMQFSHVTHCMQDPALLRGLLAGARFREVRIEPHRVVVTSPEARTLATGMIRGTPRVGLIEKRGKAVEEVLEKAAAALERVGGAKPYRSYAQAIVVEARAV